jgi:hypothetical protein
MDWLGVTASRHGQFLVRFFNNMNDGLDTGRTPVIV